VLFRSLSSSRTSTSRACEYAAGDGFAISPAAYSHAREVLVRELESAERITLARFRDLLGTSRKTAQLLLERFDADGVTRRVGDYRTSRRKTSGRL